MEKREFITENLATGILTTDKPLVFGILNTENYDVMGYYFVAGDTPECLEALGCFPEDVERADAMEVGDSIYADWPASKAILIVKMKDDR